MEWPSRSFRGEGKRLRRQAGEAQVVARRRPRPVTLYEDVALEAFALRDEIAAREFVGTVLGPIRGNGRKGDRDH